MTGLSRYWLVVAGYALLAGAIALSVSQVGPLT